MSLSLVRMSSVAGPTPGGCTIPDPANPQNTFVAQAAPRLEALAEETGGRLKITTATFWRPSGRNLNKASTGGKDEEDWGVKPDKGYDMPLAAKELNDLQDHQRDREIIHRPGKPAAVNGFQDRQLDMALE